MKPNISKTHSVYQRCLDNHSTYTPRLPAFHTLTRVLVICYGRETWQRRFAFEQRNRTWSTHCWHMIWEDTSYLDQMHGSLHFMTVYMHGTRPLRDRLLYVNVRFDSTHMEKGIVMEYERHAATHDTPKWLQNDKSLCKMVPHARMRYRRDNSVHRPWWRKWHRTPEGYAQKNHTKGECIRGWDLRSLHAMFVYICARGWKKKLNLATSMRISKVTRECWQITTKVWVFWVKRLWRIRISAGFDSVWPCLEYRSRTARSDPNWHVRERNSRFMVVRTDVIAY